MLGPTRLTKATVVPIPAKIWAAAPDAHLQNANSPATGGPSIMGTTQVGETLTTDKSGIADKDGLDNAVFTFQWAADGAHIQDTTGNTYTMAGADKGKAISIQVSFTDNAGNKETLTGAATDAVEAAANAPATGAD